MKIEDNNSHIEMGGQTLKQSSFRIGNLGMVMKILREMLYSDPINAICREITCNARDAHRVVGNDKPIQIHLPNILDRNWKVRDFGPGITPDIIENVYLGYGQSTKRNDNIQTGGFGLGSKTPFAKTNQFSIVTITNETGVNIKRAYIAHIDESEQGSLRLVYESETSEPCGTEISVPVEQRDIQSFIAATIAATQYWDDVPNSVRPILTGLDPLPAWEIEGADVLQGDDWKLYSSSNRENYGYNSLAKIILDGMSYPININHIRNISTKDRDLLSKKLRLYFNIGELTPSANREQLQYDDKTQAQILGKLEKARNEIAINLQQIVENNESYWDAILYYNKFCNTLACALPNNFNPLWNGHSVKNIAFSVPGDIGVSVYSFFMQKGRKYNEYLSKKQESKLVVADESIIYFNDLTTERVSHDRIKIILADKAIKQVQVITFADGNVEAGIERWRNAKSSSGVDIGFDITLICDDRISVVHIPKEIRDRKKLERAKRREDFDGFIFDLSYRSNRKCDNHWEPHTLIKNGGSGTYVMLHGNNKGKPSSDNNHSYTIENLRLAQTILGDDDPIIGVRESDKKFLGKNWRPLHVVLQEKVDEIKQLEDIDKLRADIESASRFRLEDMMIKLVTEFLSKLHEDSPMSKYISELKLVDKSSKESADIIAIVDLVEGRKIEKKTDANNTDLCKLHNVVTTKYSLLRFIDLWVIRSDNVGKKALIDYINAVDAANGLDFSADVVKLVG